MRACSSITSRRGDVATHRSRIFFISDSVPRCSRRSTLGLRSIRSIIYMRRSPRFRLPSMCSRSYWKRNVNRGKPRRREAAARQANQFSDQYVLLTVLVATALFFGGISGTFRSRRLQLTAFAIAVLLLVVIVVGLGNHAHL